MEWFIVIFFVSFIGLLPIGVLWVYEGILKWNSYWGKEVYSCGYFKLRFRKKNVDISHINFKQIENEIINWINQKPEFRDKALLDSIQCVLTTDIISSEGIQGIGSATINPYFWWKTFSWVLFITVDVVLIKERSLNSKGVAELILHQYFHHYLHKYTGDADAYHTSVYWKVFNR